MGNDGRGKTRKGISSRPTWKRDPASFFGRKKMRDFDVVLHQGLGVGTVCGGGCEEGKKRKKEQMDKIGRTRVVGGRGERRVVGVASMTM